MALGVLFLAVFAQIRVNLWFTPVPISLLTLGSMLLGVCLGSKKGFWATFSYLILGAFGMPFFSGGGAGFAVLTGVKGGYLLSCLIQTYLMGLLVENCSLKNPLKNYLSVFSISIIQMSLGTLWLGMIVGFDKMWLMGFIPFLPGDMMKCLAITLFISRRREGNFSLLK